MSVTPDAVTSALHSCRGDVFAALGMLIPTTAGVDMVASIQARIQRDWSGQSDAGAGVGVTVPAPVTTGLPGCLDLSTNTYYAAAEPLPTQPNVLPLPSDVGTSVSISLWMRMQATGLSDGVDVLQFPLAPGTTVWANFKASGSWYSGRVVGVNSDNTYHIAYDDGDTELSVPEECLSDRKHPFGQKSNRCRTSVIVVSQPSQNEEAVDGTPSRLQHPLPEQTPVRVLYHGGPAWLDGIVTTMHGDGTYEVLYPHGER